MTDDNVIPLFGRAWDPTPDAKLIHDLVEDGLLQYLGDGSETVRFTDHGLDVAEVLVTILSLIQDDATTAPVKFNLPDIVGFIMFLQGKT